MTVARPGGAVRRSLHAVLRSPLATAGLLWLALLLVTGVFASKIAPYSPLAQDLTATNAGPSLHHLLGTDNLGRDVLSRMLYGSVPIVVGSLVTAAVAVGVGLPIGVAAGYRGKWIDSSALWVADLTFALPSIVILIAASVITGSNIWVLTVIFGLIGSGAVIRLMRLSARGVRELPYVDVARLSGLRPRQIVVRHILPVTVAPLIVIATQIMAVALVVLAALSYLGLGGSPEQPSWGGMIAEASQYLASDPWLVVPTGGVLVVTMLALTFIGSTVRDAGPASRLGSRGRRSAQGHQPPTGSPAALASGPSLLRGQPALLEVRALRIAFVREGREVVVVDGLDLTVGTGEVVGLVGESGCGKTVTALSVPSLLPAGGRIASGSVRLDGIELTSLDRRGLGRVRGRGIGFVSQEPMAALDPSFTIRSQLGEVIRQHAGCSRSEAGARALSTLAEVGIDDPGQVARRFPHQISGGMAQRVAIAMALAGEPNLLIADEPTTALDVTVQAAILDLLRGLTDRRSMGLLLVTHDLGVVADVCDVVTVMYAGQVVESGSASEVLGRPRHPYTQGLLAATPTLAGSTGELRAIEGSVVAPEAWPVGCRFADRCPHALPACRQAPVALVGGNGPAAKGPAANGPAAKGHAARCIRSAELVGAPRRAVQG